MAKLKERNIKVYRTDENGTIICTSDGENIKFSCEPGSYNSSAQSKSNNTKGGGAVVTKSSTNSAPKQTTGSKKGETVYITSSGKKYHRSGCQYLKKSCIEIKKSDAISKGYTPCSKCNP